MPTLTLGAVLVLERQAFTRGVTVCALHGVHVERILGDMATLSKQGLPDETDVAAQLHVARLGRAVAALVLLDRVHDARHRARDVHLVRFSIPLVFLFPISTVNHDLPPNPSSRRLSTTVLTSSIIVILDTVQNRLILKQVQHDVYKKPPPFGGGVADFWYANVTAS